jgi:transcriptional regulator with XRE-family HTH domain
MSWWEYVQRHAPGDTQASIAAAAGVTGPTVSRWSTGKQGVDPRAAAAFARAYRRPVLEAFVAAGFLTAVEAKARPTAAPDYSQLSNDELLRLVRGRMKEEAIGNATSTKEAGRAGHDENVRELGRPHPKPPTWEEFESGEAAAKKTQPKRRHT